MARHGIPWVVAALALAGALPAARARDEARPVAAAIGDSIESCVDSTAIHFGREARRAILDAADTTAVGAALMRRYPAFTQSGFVPQAIVLWRKPASDWLYITLLVNPSKPGEVCFTALFVASRFEMTGGLIERYFGIRAVSD